MIVSERRKKIEGKFVEDLGHWDPHADKFSINKEAAKKWIGFGAQPTASVHNLLVKAKVIENMKKIPFHKKPAKKRAEGAK